MTAYTNVIHSATYGIHALKLTRPSTEPSARIGVIAANTNWKYTSEDSGKWNGGPVVIDGISAWPSSAVWLRTLPGSPRNVPRKPFRPEDARAAVRDRVPEAHLERPQNTTR